MIVVLARHRMQVQEAFQLGREQGDDPKLLSSLLQTEDLIVQQCSCPRGAEMLTIISPTLRRRAPYQHPAAVQLPSPCSEFHAQVATLFTIMLQRHLKALT